MWGLEDKETLRKLCFAIMNRAILDAEGKKMAFNGVTKETLPAVKKQLKADAIQFLKGEYCELVCEVIGINHDSVIAYIRRNIKNQF